MNFHFKNALVSQKRQKALKTAHIESAFCRRIPSIREDESGASMHSLNQFSKSLLNLLAQKLLRVNTAFRS